MSTEMTPMGFPAIYYAETQTGRTVTAGTAMKLAHAADVVALCRFPKWLNIPDARPGTYQVSYSPSANASLLYLAWYYRIPDVGNPGDTLAVKLEITDGTNTVAYNDARIPRAFQKYWLVKAAAPSSSRYRTRIPSSVRCVSSIRA